MNLLRNSKVGIVSCTLAASVGVGLASSAASASASTARSHASISIKSFTPNFSALASLKSVTAKGKGKIAAILPDTTSSTRYVEFDAPDLKAAAAAAGTSITVQNGQGSDTTFLSDAKADISNGATVLIIDPEDQGTGVAVQELAKKHGVKVIQYDRLSSGSGAVDTDPYVSFNNVTVGQLIGKGFVSCAASWLGGKEPQFIEMHGAPTDNNATLFTDGYDSVLDPLEKAGKIKQVANTAGTWNPTTPSPDALDEFKAAFTANKSANSAVIPNDENGAPIIAYLKSQGVGPDQFPTTGQDATLTGLDNILSGYQCGTVYKPIFEEAGAAVALAVYERAGVAAPKALLNGKTKDPSDGKLVPSVLLNPEWVTAKNMKSTVVADKFVPVSQLCASPYAADCKKYGI